MLTSVRTSFINPKVMEEPYFSGKSMELQANLGKKLVLYENTYTKLYTGVQLKLPKSRSSKEGWVYSLSLENSLVDYIMLCNSSINQDVSPSYNSIELNVLALPGKRISIDPGQVIGRLTLIKIYGSAVRVTT